MMALDANEVLEVLKIVFSVVIVHVYIKIVDSNNWCYSNHQNTPKSYLKTVIINNLVKSGQLVFTMYR